MTTSTMENTRNWEIVHSNIFGYYIRSYNHSDEHFELLNRNGNFERQDSDGQNFETKEEAEAFLKQYLGNKTMKNELSQEEKEEIAVIVRLQLTDINTFVNEFEDEYQARLPNIIRHILVTNAAKLEKLAGKICPESGE